jgi:hypothetical protein
MIANLGDLKQEPAGARAVSPVLFSYVLAQDYGTAPHLFQGLMSLAICKPTIRKRARVGDWVLGTCGKKYSGEHHRSDLLVFAMQVTQEPMLFENYFREYPERRPCAANPLGDNIYYRVDNRVDNRVDTREDNRDQGLKQLPTVNRKPEKAKRDLGGRFVLLSTRYVYLGSSMLELPSSLSPDLVKKGPGYKSNFPPELVQGAVDFFESLRARGAGPGSPNMIRKEAYTKL